MHYIKKGQYKLIFKKNLFQTSSFLARLLFFTEFIMKFSNVTRWKGKKGKFDELVAMYSKNTNHEGQITSFMIQTGEDTGCIVEVWESRAHFERALPKLIAYLDSIRSELEILSDKLGVTDPVSGPIVYEM